MPGAAALAFELLRQHGHQHYYPHADYHYGQIYCSAGGGIVADSQEEADIRKLLIKLIRYYANWRSKTGIP